MVGMIKKQGQLHTYFLSSAYNEGRRRGCSRLLIKEIKQVGFPKNTLYSRRLRD